MSTADSPARQILSPYALLIVLAAAVPLVIFPKLVTNLWSAQFLPHRFCYLGDSSLTWLHVSADAIIGVSYVVISATLAYMVHRSRQDIPFSWMFLAFGLFIVACGFTHFMEVLTVWKPLYWLAGDIKVVTALASATTALTLPTLIPKVSDMLSAARVSRERQVALQEANARLQEFAEIRQALSHQQAVGIASWEYDPATDRVMWIGDVEAVTGRSAEEGSTAAKFMALVHPEDRERVREALERGLTERGEYEAEFRMMLPDGSVRWLAGRGRAFRSADGRVRMLGMNMDVSTRKQSERALMTAEKLAVTGRLAASIAHEINNPLSSVMNLLYLIEQRSESPELRDLSSTALKEIGRVSHIVRQTLGFYRDSTRPMRVELSEVLDGVLALYAPQTREKQLVIEKDYRAGANVEGFPGELRQVFANLVSNAIAAAPPGGKLVVRLTNVDGSVRVSIADTGSGIPEFAREQIFHPFFTTKGEKGTGLGLWVSNGIVSKHGGRMRFRTREGQGTVFSVSFPPHLKVTLMPQSEITKGTIEEGS